MTHTWTPETDTSKPDSGVDYRTVKTWFQQCRDLAAAIEIQKQKYSASGTWQKNAPRA